jgi:hypothetical protein
MATDEKSHNVDFAKGGKTHMFGKQSAGEQRPGVTEHDAEGGAPGAKYAEGGRGKMFGYNPAVPATAGITGPR